MYPMLPDLGEPDIKSVFTFFIFFMPLLARLSSVFLVWASVPIFPCPTPYQSVIRSLAFKTCWLVFLTCVPRQPKNLPRRSLFWKKCSIFNRKLYTVNPKWRKKVLEDRKWLFRLTASKRIMEHVFVRRFSSATQLNLTGLEATAALCSKDWTWPSIGEPCKKSISQCM